MKVLDRRIEIKNAFNIPIGYLREDDSVIIAFSFKKGYVGRYVKSSNITFDGPGKIFCFGDGTDTLVRNADK